MSRQCRDICNIFCHICGEYTLKAHWRTMTALVKKAYELYFGCKVVDQDQVCTIWELWSDLEVNAICIPNDMARKEGSRDCYFCLTSVSGFSAKNKKSIEYPNLLSAMRPVPHDDSLPVLRPREAWSLDEADDDATMHEHDVDLSKASGSS